VADKSKVTWIAGAVPKWSCDEANNLKFDAPRYRKLSSANQVLLDQRWKQCDLQKQQAGKRPSPEDEFAVAVVNPVAMSKDDKILWGLVKRKDVENAEKNCKGAGQYGGAALTVYGAVTGNPAMGEIGRAAFSYGDVSCEALKDEALKGNLTALLGPHNVIARAAGKKIADDLLKGVKIVSDEDRRKLLGVLDKGNQATKPPQVTIKDCWATAKTLVGTVKTKVPC
jgi:hypothetical protein